MFRLIIAVTILLIAMSSTALAKKECSDRDEFLWRIMHGYLEDARRFDTDKTAGEWFIKKTTTDLDTLKKLSKTKDDAKIFEYFYGLGSIRLVPAEFMSPDGSYRYDDAVWFRDQGYKRLSRTYDCVRDSVEALAYQHKNGKFIGLVVEWRKSESNDFEHFKRLLGAQRERIAPTKD